MPECLFCIRWERKAPPCTMDATKDGAKGSQEHDVEPLGISMSWSIECRNVGGVSKEGKE